jgi:hypothetical protein
MRDSILADILSLFRLVCHLREVLLDHRGEDHEQTAAYSASSDVAK